MASAEDHLAKAERNADFALDLNLATRAEVDWAMVCLFYSALHFVEAYLVDIGQPARTHGKREQMFAKDVNLRQIAEAYWDLKSFGFRARYEFPDFRKEDVLEEAVPALESIRRHVLTLLQK